MKTTTSRALAAGVLASAAVIASAQTTPIYGDLADYILTPAGAGNPNGPDFRIGGNGANAALRNATLVFEIPTLAAGQHVEDASLGFTYTTPTGTVDFNADLWIIGATTLDGSGALIPLVEQLAAPTETGDANRADNVLVQAGILTPGSEPNSSAQNRDRFALGRNTFTDDAGDGLITDWFQDFYLANPEYSGGQYLVFRLNPDAVPTAGVGYNIATGNVIGQVGDQFTPPLTIEEAMGAAPLLTLEIVPAPGTAGVMLAGGLLLTRRRR